MTLPFPTDSQFVPLTRNGVPIGDPAGDESPAATDIVGNINFPAVFFCTDGTYAFFRFRVNGDPQLGGGFANYAWVVLFDTDINLANSYEWELALDGTGERLALIQNTVKNSPGTGFNDQAEGTPIFFPITAYDIARATLAVGSNFNGNPDYFLDFGISISTLKTTMGISDDTPLRFNYFTSANFINFNKDFLCPASDFASCFSDPLQLSTSLSGNIVNKENGCPVGGALVELFDETGNLIATTSTNASGHYSFPDIDPGTYSVIITKLCYLKNCLCNSVTVVGNRNNIFNISLAPDCICEIKCLIANSEKNIIAEKERIYQAFTDFFLDFSPTGSELCKMVLLLCLLNECTGALDCSVAKVLTELGECKGGDCND